eukprot:TRINITY_DN4077_c0_g1_i1.p1 TRINITY_DN4077_c0_g1~~TRINITY_DN4077_c0_g1_i1.p1  ORF type:complete len:294 (+),score=31.79 TRINITY_DN4077_c0_g1_i1:30-884(+)
MAEDASDPVQEGTLIRLNEDPVFVQAMTEPYVPKFSLSLLAYCGKFGRVYRVADNLLEVRFDGSLKRLVSAAAVQIIFEDPMMRDVCDDWRPGQRCLLKPDPLFVHTVTERLNCNFCPSLLRFCGKIGRVERVNAKTVDVRFDTRDKRRRVPATALLPVEDDGCMVVYDHVLRGMYVRVKDDQLYVQCMISATSNPLPPGILDFCGCVGVVQKVDPSHTKVEVRFDSKNLWAFPMTCLIPVEPPAPNSARRLAPLSPNRPTRLNDSAFAQQYSHTTPAPTRFRH